MAAGCDDYCAEGRSGSCRGRRRAPVLVLAMIENRGAFVVEASRRNRVARWSINTRNKEKNGTVFGTERGGRELGNRPMALMRMMILGSRDGRKKGANKGSY